MSKENLRPRNLSSAERAAVLLLSLGKNTASEVMKLLDEDEVSRIVKAFPNVSDAPTQTHNEVQHEFSKLLNASEKLLVDGKSFAKGIMESVLGSSDSLDESDSVEEIRDMLLTVPDEVLRDFLSAEHLQTSAFLISMMDPEQSARVVSGMGPTEQYDLLMRVAYIKPINRDLILEVKEIIREQLIGNNVKAGTSIDGKKAAANILSAMSSSNSKRVLEEIGEIEPQTREEIELLVFTFEDLLKLSAKSLQSVIQAAPRDILVLALRGASPELKTKVFNNVSERVREFMEEELEVMGQRRKADVHKAQADIIDIARRLEVEGTISLSAEDSEVWV